MRRKETCIVILQNQLTILLSYDPEFDSLLTKKVPQTALAAAFGTFVNFLIARYAFGFFVCEQIFLIFFIGTICFEVQKPNASCRASVSSLLV